ncbi:D-alanyl-D-alanine carboxypeptidase family protein [Nocardia sp. CC227C]|uniref:D-alanyl-D-alanine carboxypeptidase family protein n=1 Tax=Nocardia sp. CC227C TaxID=3044562 RepID=UPI00355714C1
MVNSGWRSPDHQNRLLRQAVAKYGSRAAAARWVATAETSAHVSGDAVDLASDAAKWLAAHGAGYGLCQIYANEPWHVDRLGAQFVVRWLRAHVSRPRPRSEDVALHEPGPARSANRVRP